MAIGFASKRMGVIVGASGTAFATKDGGLSWQKVPNVAKKDLRAVSFVSNVVGVMVGQNGTLLRTTNGGKTWDVIANPMLAGEKVG